MSKMLSKILLAFSFLHFQHFEKKTFIKLTISRIVMLTSQQPSVDCFEKKAERESLELLASGCPGVRICGVSCLTQG